MRVLLIRIIDQELQCKTLFRSEQMFFLSRTISQSDVITHFGQTGNEGHYYTTLYRNGKWIYINDEKISDPENDAPKMGYLFFLIDTTSTNYVLYVN